jgi:hypothetical protein
MGDVPHQTSLTEAQIVAILQESAAGTKNIGAVTKTRDLGQTPYNWKKFASTIVTHVSGSSVTPTGALASGIESVL